MGCDALKIICKALRQKVINNVVKSGRKWQKVVKNFHTFTLVNDTVVK